MLQVVNLSKGFGERTLFEEVSFSMIAGERLGLVGRNGCGKSTLFRIILGEEHPDSGKVTWPKGYKVGHLAQHLKFTEPTILEEACLGLPPDERDQQYRGQIILDGLGFSEADFLRAPHEFSGGFQIRINLAKLLLSEPNLLLLDEPTNYLDILSARWLEGFLQDWKGELILISHDRLFMDAVTTHTMLVHRGAVRKVSGGTEKLYAQVAVDEEIYEKTRLNEDKKRKQLETFVARFRAQASKASLVQSKMKALERMGVKEELQDEEVLDFEFCEAPHPGKQLADIRNVSFGYAPGTDLIGGLSLIVGKGDRIGVIGKNGKGKSTLLKLLAGELTPSSGSISLSQNAKLGFFGQTNIDRLDAKKSVEEEISNANPRHHRTKVRAICGTMMFSGDDALKRVSVLSGGERSRVLLGKILAEPTNLLLLDEPTNHLDMESIEALIDSLQSYQGALLIVTHSELILRQVATRLIVFQGDTPEVFNHDYDYFLEKHGWGDGVAMSTTNSKPARAVVLSEEGEREVKRLETHMAKVEERIYKWEDEVARVEAKVAEAFQGGNQEEAADGTQRLQDLRRKIDDSFSELERLSTEVLALRSRGSQLVE